MSAVTDTNSQKARAKNSGRPANTPVKTGRPSTYSPEIAQRICEHIATGGYATNLKRFGLPHESTICDWQNKIPEFAEAYARARERRAETFADQMVEIADTCDDPQKARLQIDTRKWIAAKLLPRVYGENQRVEVQHTISETAARVLADLAQRQKERKRLEAQVIDVTPVHSLTRGDAHEQDQALAQGCTDFARVERQIEGGAVDPRLPQPPRPPAAAAAPSRSAKPRRKK